ncbi:MAG: hypothetical protein ACLRZ7_00805 [Lachnospiraceae bacterium]
MSVFDNYVCDGQMDLSHYIEPKSELDKLAQELQELGASGEDIDIAAETLKKNRTEGLNETCG